MDTAGIQILINGLRAKQVTNDEKAESGKTKQSRRQSDDYA